MERAEHFIQLFTVLRSNDSEAIPIASQEIVNNSLAGDAIPALCLILQTNPDPFYRFQAATTIKLAVRGLIGEDFNDINLINNMLTILNNERESVIRGFLVYLTSTLINTKSFNLAMDFSQSALQSRNKISIHISILLLNELTDYFENDNEYAIQFINELVTAAISFNDIQITLDALSLFFTFTNKKHSIPGEKATQLWGLTVSLIQPLLSDEKHFDILSSLIADCVDFGAIYVDVTPVLPLCIQILSQPNIDSLVIRNSLILIIDSIIVIHPDFVLQTQSVFPILQIYIQLTISDFNPSEFEDYDSTLFKNIIQKYNSDARFVEGVWNIIKQFPQDDCGYYISSLLLQHLFNPRIEFFYGILNDIVSIIMKSISSTSVLTSQAGIDCFDEFIDNFDDIDQYHELFVNFFVNILKERQSIPYIDALTHLLKCIDNTDPFFESVYPFLVGFITAAPPEYRLSLIYCLSILTLHSYKGVVNHYNDIFPFLMNLLTDSSAESSLYKGDTVECFGKLIRVIPDQFLPSLESFTQMVLSFLSESDPALLNASINTIGTIIEFYPNEIRPLIPQILESMAHFSEMDDSEKLGSVRDLMKQNCTDEEINEYVGNCVVNKESMEVAGGAFLVFSSILCKYPESIPDNIERFVNLVQKLSTSYYEFSTHSVCKGVYYLMEGFLDTDFRAPELFELIYVNLQIIIESARSVSIISDAVDAIAALIHMGGLRVLGPRVSTFPDEIINILKRNFNYIMFEEEDPFPYDLFLPLNHLFSSLFIVLSPEERPRFFQAITPVIMEFTQKSIDDKAFALEILMIYANNGMYSEPDNYVNLFNLAFECASNDHVSGFINLELLAEIVPDLLRVNKDKLLELYTFKLNSSKKSVVDSCVGAMATFAMNVMDKEFPLDKLGAIALSKMPPSCNYEEATVCYNFLTWMIPLGFNFLKNDIIGALARLFALPPNKLSMMGIPPDVFNTIKAFFTKILQIPNAIQVCFEAVGNDPATMEYIRAQLTS